MELFLPMSKHLHNARFATPDELNYLVTSTLDEPGLLIGKDESGRLLRVKQSPTRRELGNVYVVGRTRCGKGLFGESQILTWPDSIVVFDIKGELRLHTADFRSRFSDIYTFHPDGKGDQYDPFAGMHRDRDFQSAATNLLYNEHENDPIFTKRAINMLTQLFHAAKAENRRVLPYVYQMIHLGLDDVVDRLQAVDPLLATKFLDRKAEHADMDNKFLNSAWSSLVAEMNMLLTKETVRCFNGSDFTAKDIMKGKRPVTVYLEFPERDLLALAPFVKLIWTSLVSEMIEIFDNSDPKECRQVSFHLDEAARIELPKLDEYSSTVVGRNMILWMAFQSISQADAIYGHDRAKVLRDNCDTQIYYRPTNLDTAGFLERRLGRRSDWAQSTTSHDGVETSQGSSEYGVPVMTAQEIMQMGDEEILAFHSNLPPIKGKRMDWRHYPVLEARRKRRPPELLELPEVTEIVQPWPSLRAGQGSSQFVNPDLIH